MAMPVIRNDHLTIYCYSGCGGTFDSDFGEIFSPGYPVNYAHNTLCDYVIVASPDQFIVVQFDDSNFRIECEFFASDPLILT